MNEDQGHTTMARDHHQQDDKKIFNRNFSLIPGFSTVKPDIFHGRGTVGIYNIIRKAFPQSFGNLEYPDIEVVADYENIIHFIPNEENMTQKDVMYLYKRLENGKPFTKLTLKFSAVLDKMNLSNKSVPFRVIDVQRFIGNEYGEDMVGHRNLLLIDLRNQTVEFFEPHGLNIGHEYIHKQLQAHFKKIEFKVMSPTLACPRMLGPQAKLGKMDQGWCTLWSAFYLVYRMLHPELMPDTIAKRMTAGTVQEVHDRFMRFHSLINRAIQINKGPNHR